MGMSKMQGALADAIRSNRVEEAKEILADYRGRDKSDFIEKRRDKYLKDAIRLAKGRKKGADKIIEAITKVQASRSGKEQ
jgi:hypothetical protein